MLRIYVETKCFHIFHPQTTIFVKVKDKLDTLSIIFSIWLWRQNQDSQDGDFGTAWTQNATAHQACGKAEELPQQSRAAETLLLSVQVHGCKHGNTVLPHSTSHTGEVSSNTTLNCCNIAIITSTHTSFRTQIIQDKNGVFVIH